MAFKNIQQFISAVSLQTRKLKDYGLKEVNGLAGFHPPISTVDTLLKLAKEESIVRSRATILDDPEEESPDAALPIAVLKQGDDGISGKMQVVWFNDGSEMPEIDTEFTEIRLEPSEVGGSITLSDKLINNGSSSKYIEKLIKECINEAEDEKFLVGSGMGCPLGAANCPGRIEVDRDTAATIKLIDTINMISKLPPESMENAIFVANQSLVVPLMNLKDESNHSTFKAGNKALGIPATLSGFPVKWTDKTAAAGQRGDLMLCDFRYYAIKNGSPLRIDVSNVAGFTKNKSQIRITWNVDGQGIVAKPLKLKNGNYASPFVVLK